MCGCVCEITAGGGARMVLPDYQLVAARQQITPGHHLFTLTSRKQQDVFFLTAVWPGRLRIASKCQLSPAGLLFAKSTSLGKILNLSVTSRWTAGWHLNKISGLEKSCFFSRKEKLKVSFWLYSLENQTSICWLSWTFFHVELLSGRVGCCCIMSACRFHVSALNSH